jgi:hypothetical protein
MSEQKSPGSTHASQEAQASKQPSPVPSVRLSIHTPPTPARRTSLTSDTGSFVLRSPFVFGDFQTRTLPGTDSRCVSEMIQEGLDAAYQAG